MSPRRSSRLTAGAEYPVEFKQFWALYPKRAGANPKRRAFAAWCARLEEGTEIRRILEGSRAYARFCAATGKLNTEYVLQAATFLGEDRHFELPWSLPSKPAKPRFAPKPPPESEAMKVRSEYPGRGRVTSGTPTALAEVLNGDAERKESQGDAESRITRWENEDPAGAELAWREAHEEVLAEPNFRTLPPRIVQKLIQSRYRLGALKQIDVSARDGSRAPADRQANRQQGKENVPRIGAALGAATYRTSEVVPNGGHSRQSERVSPVQPFHGRRTRALCGPPRPLDGGVDKRHVTRYDQR